MRSYVKAVSGGIASLITGVAIGLVIGTKKGERFRRRVLHEAYSDAEFMHDFFTKMQTSLNEKKEHSDMQSEIGVFCDVFDNDGSPVAIVTDLKADDLGKVGEEFLRVPGVTEHSNINVVIEAVS